MATLPSMLDRAFRSVFANFTTMFLVVAVIALPVHLAFTFAFKEVIEVSELHDEIAAFPPDRTVREVGPASLTTYRAGLVLLTVFDVAALALLVRPTRRVLRDAAAGRVPTATGAWLRIGAERGGYLRAWSRAGGSLIAAFAVAALLVYLSGRVALLAAQPLGDARAWVGNGLARALALSLGAPFFLATWAIASFEAKAEVSEMPKLY